MRYTNLKSIKNILELFLSHFSTVILVYFEPWISANDIGVHDWDFRRTIMLFMKYKFNSTKTLLSIMAVLQVTGSVFRNLFQPHFPPALNFQMCYNTYSMWNLICQALGSFNSQAFTSIDKWLNSNQVRSPFQETVKMFEGECKATEKYLNSKD